MKISILTPTFNRGKLLKRLYDSIKNNITTCKCSVEWLIMDDGSTDDTKKIIEKYKEEQIVDIRYYYQENKGKMEAINNLVPKVKGDYIVECDSDDYFTNNALSIIEDSIKEVNNKNDIYAFVFLKYDQDGNNMGNNFKEDKYKSKMFDLYFKENVYGEKALVFNSEIRKKYKYELENGEKFVTEARLHHKMDLKYDVECFNKPIMICENKKDGYTINIQKIYKENPFGYYEYFKEILNLNLKNVKFKKLMYIYKHYILFSVLTKKKNILKNVKGLKNKIAIAILFLPAKIMTKKRF